MAGRGVGEGVGWEEREGSGMGGEGFGAKRDGHRAPRGGWPVWLQIPIYIIHRHDRQAEVAPTQPNPVGVLKKHGQGPPVAWLLRAECEAHACPPFLRGVLIILIFIFFIVQILRAPRVGHTKFGLRGQRRQGVPARERARWLRYAH
jgi:hypothetical protein